MKVVMSEGMRRLAEMFCGCSDSALTWKLIFDELIRLDRQEYDECAGLAAAIWALRINM